MIRRYEGQHLRLLLLLGILLTLHSLPAPAAGSPALPEGLAAPNQSTSMPEFELPDAHGATIRSAALQGRVSTREELFGRYLCAKRSWAVIDKQGVIRYMRTNEPRNWQPPNDAILKVLSELK